MAREDQLARMFVDLADTMVDDFDLVDLAQTLVERCVELFGASAAGILLAPPGGELQVLASSSEQMRVVEAFEVQAAEGPCLEASRSGQPVAAADLAAVPQRWPRFIPVALGSGFRSAQAVPIRLRGRNVGALNLFGTEPGELSPADLRAAQALADAAAIAILQQQALQDAQLLAAQLQTALSSRIVIEQAKGMLAQSFAINVDRAFHLLRRYARNRNLMLTDVCRGVVDGTVDPSVIGAPAPVHRDGDSEA